MFTNLGRAAVQRLPLRTIATSSVVSRLVSRAAPNQRGLAVLVSDLSRSGALRSFATKTETTEPAKKTTKKTVKKTTKKKPTKKTTKAAAKPKKAKKVEKKKPATRKVKKPLSPEKEEQLKIRELKMASLYYAESKAKVTKVKLPSTAYLLWISEKLKGNSRDALATQEAFTKVTNEWKTVSGSELAGLKRTAEANKLQNEANHKAWVESYTVEEIQRANRARQMLKRKFNYPAKRPVHLLKDDRRPLGVRSPFTYYVKARWASGDFENQTASSGIKTQSEEWKNLSAAEKAPYEELSRADRARRAREQSVLSE
ncbi:hypothetical protein PFICI_01213 [Pestalotiopsis fici W106-1]|uniref:HMG box domain-containing protein n=1 Tax=Pestalotiopsis fici (strain W106-1 / CGMCC3.15140) TaxID=1229662 RepID=W3XN72_PESFW|nr:uncharacterized protein PFICI_01213 [Pestalotiopsis fici W106-1]ETS87385.1 hypothetical protein PFICI_01213 [Pestalotiopsis fici W106-1]